LIRGAELTFVAVKPRDRLDDPSSEVSTSVGVLVSRATLYRYLGGDAA
jgi:hypothetical protein